MEVTMEFLSFNGENYIRADAIVAITTPKTPPPTVLVHLLAGEACWSIPFDFDTREEAVDAARKIMATLNKENKITETNLGQGSERDVEPTIRVPIAWLVRALVALAKRHLAEANAKPEVQAGGWPAGQEWHELGHTSQHVFMYGARTEAGIPHAEYRAMLEAIMKTGEGGALDALWAELESKRKQDGKRVHG